MENLDGRLPERGREAVEQPGAGAELRSLAGERAAPTGDDERGADEPEYDDDDRPLPGGRVALARGGVADHDEEREPEHDERGRHDLLPVHVLLREQVPER